MTTHRTSTDPLLIARHADVLVTMDAQRREIADGALVARGGVIEWVGATADLPVPYRDAIAAPTCACWNCATTWSRPAWSTRTTTWSRA